jgi:hypothetical protein
MSREAMQKAFQIIGMLKPDNFVHRQLQGEAWDSLRQALENPEPQVCCGDYEKCWKACTPRGRWLAEQEIVTSESHIVKWSIPVDPNNFGEPLAQFEQEPVAWMVRDQVDGCRYPSALKNPAGSINGESKPLYTAAPRKPWVGLTNDEINDFSAGCHLGKSVQSAICQAAAKLKEKNT